MRGSERDYENRNVFLNNKKNFHLKKKPLRQMLKKEISRLR